MKNKTFLIGVAVGAFSMLGGILIGKKITKRRAQIKRTHDAIESLIPELTKEDYDLFFSMGSNDNPHTTLSDDLLCGCESKEAVESERCVCGLRHEGSCTWSEKEKEEEKDEH